MHRRRISGAVVLACACACAWYHSPSLGREPAASSATGVGHGGGGALSIESQVFDGNGSIHQSLPKTSPIVGSSSVGPPLQRLLAIALRHRISDRSIRSKKGNGGRIHASVVGAVSCRVGYCCLLPAASGALIDAHIPRPIAYCIIDDRIDRGHDGLINAFRIQHIQTGRPALRRFRGVSKAKSIARPRNQG